MKENEKWYKKSFRRCLVDMHIPDWDKDYFFSKFDSSEYIRSMKKAGVDTAYIYCNSCTGICNWPTKVGHMHEGLKGRDIVRELTEGLRDEGITVIAYINIWSKWACQEHPDWQCLNQNGEPTLSYMWNQPGRYGEACMNSPYQEYVLKLVRELCENYEFQGLWVDMILWRVMCYCPHCRERFRKETGYELPEKVDWDDVVWRTWLKKREEWNYEFFENIINTAKAIKPDLTIMCNSANYPNYFMGASLEFLRLGEFIGGDFNMARYNHAFECKFYNSVTANKPFEFLGSVMDPDLYEHSIVKSMEHLRSLMGSTLLNNGRYGFIDAIDPAGTLNDRVYKRMAELYSIERKYEKYLCPEVTFLSDVGLYTNMESKINPANNGNRVLESPLSSPHQDGVRKMAEPLIDQHITFSVLTPYDLDRLADYKIIILDWLMVLSEKEAEAFEKYVGQGGCLYVQGETAVYNEAFQRVEKGRLQEVLGAYSSGKVGSKITYIRPKEGFGELLCGYDKEHPLSVNASQVELKLLSGEPLAYVTLPLVDPEDKEKFASAITDPPGQHTEFPSIVFNQYGKGRTIWSAAQFEYMKKPDQRKVFRNLLEKLLDGRKWTIETNAPRCVEMSIYHQEEKGRYILNLLNFPSELPATVAHGIEVTMDLPQRVEKILYLPEEKEVPFYYTEDGRVTLQAEPLEIFDMYAIIYE